jgi:hypothetical protein
VGLCRSSAPWRPGFQPSSGHVEFEVDKAELGQVLSILRFPVPIIPPNAPHSSSSGVGTVGQIVTDVPNGLILTPPKDTKKQYGVSIWT